MFTYLSEKCWIWIIPDEFVVSGHACTEVTLTNDVKSFKLSKALEQIIKEQKYSLGQLHSAGKAKLAIYFGNNQGQRQSKLNNIRNNERKVEDRKGAMEKECGIKHKISGKK